MEDLPKLKMYITDIDFNIELHIFLPTKERKEQCIFVVIFVKVILGLHSFVRWVCASSMLQV